MVTYRNEKTLPYQSLTNPDISNPIDMAQESWCFENNFNQYSIPPHHLKLDQFQTLDKLASFHFKEIKLDCEYDPDP